MKESCHRVAIFLHVACASTVVHSQRRAGSRSTACGAGRRTESGIGMVCVMGPPTPATTPASPDWWSAELEFEGIEHLVTSQDGVVSRRQWMAAHRTQTELRRRLRQRRWQVMFPGVYLSHTGVPSRLATTIAGLLYAGRGAMWCHETAAEQWGLLKPHGIAPVHILIAADRRVLPQPGLRIHVSQAAQLRLSTVVPPRVTPAHAVLDCVETSPTFESALGRVADCCQTRRVTLDAIACALTARRVKWGSQLKAALESTLIGSDSLLEVRYVRDVEVAHGLPSSRRQRLSGSDLADCSYDEHGVLVELDGRVHLLSHRRWRDMRKDNRSAMRGELTLHYGYVDVSEEPCAVALQVFEALCMRGYLGPVRSCRRVDCAVGAGRRLITSAGGTARRTPLSP